MTTVLALADDLTGALEVGGKFAGRGIKSRVITAAHGPFVCPVEVIDLESRHLPEHQAAAAVAAVPASDARVIYKKTDSTLRGNIGAELRALARVYPDWTIAYIPAYPALGRTVRHGQLHVYGVPVHQTAFAADPLNPITDSSIARVVGPGLRCIIHEGETDADVSRAMAAALADPCCRIIAGPASVAAEIAAQLDLPAQPVSPWPQVKTCLIVNGSLHNASARQISFAESHGCASAVAGALWRIVRPKIRTGLRPFEIAAETGVLVREYLTNSAIDALMVFGGDTAFGILKALGCPALEPIGEVITGVPVSRVVGRELCLITKAGGFGEEPLICSLKRILYGID